MDKYSNEDKRIKKIDVTKRKKHSDIGLGELEYSIRNTNHIGEIEKFHSSQGHGFAAEQANNLIDVLKGRNATVIGGDNAKDGADRLVDGQYIQTKYCQTAYQSVDAAFENHRYRYVDANGKAMQLEVPADQYEQAIAEMQKRIERGEVPGYKNPKDAQKIVRKGNVTYKQAVNIAKAGTIESIMFDAANSAVISVSAFGISAAVTFAKSIWDGKPLNVAVEKSLCAGLKIGGVTFISSLASAQLVKSGLNSSMRKTSETVVKKVLTSTKSKQVMINYFEKGAKMYGTSAAKQMAPKQATEKAAKLLRGNVIATVVLIVVLSSNDIKNSFSGKISGKQLFKNIMTLAAGIVSGHIGSYAGASIGALVPIPGASAVGFYVGGFVGGTVGGIQTNKNLSKFIEDDAIKMVKILEKRFIPLVESYFLSKEEMEIVLDDLNLVLGKEKLLEMFASDDREKFADNLLTNIIERVVKNRSIVYLPSKEMYMEALDRMNDRAIEGLPLINEANVDPVAVGQRILAREVEVKDARKALYVAKQMNNVNAQSEYLLHKSQNNELNRQKRAQELESKRNILKEAVLKNIGE